MGLRYISALQSALRQTMGHTPLYARQLLSEIKLLVTKARQKPIHTWNSYCVRNPIEPHQRCTSSVVESSLVVGDLQTNCDRSRWRYMLGAKWNLATLTILVRGRPSDSSPTHSRSTWCRMFRPRSIAAQAMPQARPQEGTVQRFSFRLSPDKEIKEG